MKRIFSNRNLPKIPLRPLTKKNAFFAPDNLLIRSVIEEFGPRFVPGGVLIYAGDTGEKWGYFDETLLASLGVTVDAHGKMPDVVFHYPDKNWLLLVKSVTSHGPVDGKRHEELAHLFVGSTVGLVYVTAFPNRSLMARYLPEIAWETEVWVADAPSHLIHFNGERFLGPYG
jgi:BsuBI/PstI restriction endonuclease domain